VSEPGRQYMWILSRSPRMEPAVYADVLARLARKGLDLQKLELTRQED
jgi:apolipoprotein D and lipocalin family protein